MSESSGFFPDVNGDREYTSEWLAKYVASFIGNGVYNGELAVTAGNGMTVTIPPGRAWINGYYYCNDGNLTLAIDNADGVLNRIDVVVLRWDVNARNITAQVIKGTPASTATAPNIVRTVEQYDLKLAEISIPAGTTSITQALITDKRLDKSVCGIVTGVVSQVDTTALYNQIQADLQNFRTVNEADFSAWFDSVKGILGTDEAGNLLAKINDLAGDGRTMETVKANADAIAAHIARTDNPHGVTAAQVGAIPSTTNVVRSGNTHAINIIWPDDGTLHMGVDGTDNQAVHSAAYAAGFIALTTPGLRNQIIILKTDSIPSGLADGTIVYRYTP